MCSLKIRINIIRGLGLIATMISLISIEVAAQKHHKIILMAGQSNMVGVGEVTNLPAEYKRPAANIQIYVSWHADQNYINKWIPVFPNLGAELGDFGPEISFAKKISELNPEENFALIKISRGATDLYNDWRSVSAATESAPVGVYYTNFVKGVRLALDALPAGDTYEISGMLWMQGESDGTSPIYSAAYEMNLRWFIYDIRNEFDVPDMPFIIGKIDIQSAWKYNSAIRIAQDKIAEKVNNVGIFDTNGLQTDGIHYTASGNISLGDSFAIHLNPLFESKTSIGLKNEAIEIRCDLNRGGSIYYLSPADKSLNVVNTHDAGRYIQQSYYAGYEINRQAQGQKPEWSPWPWNPIQGGDCYENRPRVLDYSEAENLIYVKTRPLLWDMNNEEAECDFEQWVSLEGNAVHVTNRITVFRTDNIWTLRNRDQELPAVYTIGDLNRLITYKGTNPWTNEAVSEIINSGPPWISWLNKEHWAAYINKDDWGLGVYNEICTEILGGFHGSPRSGKTYDNSTGYISPLTKLQLWKNTVYEYDYWLILGTLQEIRTFVYNKHFTTGIDQTGNFNQSDRNTFFGIYPNPARDQIQIETRNIPEYRLKIISANGRLEFANPSLMKNSKLVNVSQLAQGLYSLILITDQETLHREFIKY